jgi:hypothetical protein
MHPDKAISDVNGDTDREIMTLYRDIFIKQKEVSTAG